MLWRDCYYYLCIHRIIAQHLDEFKDEKIIRHISSKHTTEMSKKSEVIS